jgi:hypothetical protein
MIGVYDFCGHYEWTFSWLEQWGGPGFLEEYWDEAIGRDSQSHAGHLISEQGLEGMKRYWGHTLAEEGAGYTSVATDQIFRINMTHCPSKGFLLQNQLNQHTDYCNHCIGWIGPLMDKAGFETLHEHNHCGQCWWEFRKRADSGVEPISDNSPQASPSSDDVRNGSDWNPPGTIVDRFKRT